MCAEDSMMHNKLKFLSSVDGLYGTFFNWQKTPKFLEIWTKLQMSKLEETFSISEAFKYFTFDQDVLHYIHQGNLWLEQK